MSQPRNTIRTFALVCVALTSGFLIWLAVKLVNILAADDWCERAMGAADDVQGRVRAEFAVSGCFKFLDNQLDALALNSHIAIGVIAMCLAVLMVIVIAGGKLSFTGNARGVSMNVGADREEARADGARQVERAAREERRAVEQGEA